MKLYELTEKTAELRRLSDEGMTDQQAIAEVLDKLDGQFEEKAKALVHVTRNIESDVSELDAEIDRLKARKKSIVDKEAWLKEYLQSNMRANGITRIECPLFTITLAAGRDMVEIVDEDQLPDEYVNVKSTVQPDKKMILDDLKAGKEVAGARLTKSRESLRIR